VLRPAHRIFEAPFRVDASIESTPCPDNFKKWKPSVGETVPTFEIFRSAEGDQLEPGLVTGNHGFEETPDAEMILGGINMKGPDYAAIARHGSLVMWGFHCAPDRLTDAGRRLFLNVIAYANAHRGALVETLRLRPSRTDLDDLLTIFMGLYPVEDRDSVIHRTYAGETIPPAVLVAGPEQRKWIDERLPYLHPANSGDDWDTQFQLTIDGDLKELGCGNGTPEFLDSVAARLAKHADDALALRLLARYVPDVEPGEFAPWLEQNRARAYFTEAGGWVWRVRGTRAESPVLRTKDADAKDPVRVTVEYSETMLTVTLRIRRPYHCYAAGAKDGDPVRVDIAEGSAFAATGEAIFECDEDQQLHDAAQIKVPIERRARGGSLTVTVAYTVCDAAKCLPRKTLTFTK
jgi:hypothetical protein